MSRHSHRLRLLLLSVAVLLVLPASGALGQTRHKLTQAGFRVLYMAPAFIALEKGFFTRRASTSRSPSSTAARSARPP